VGPCEHPPSRLKNQHKGKSPLPRCRARRPRSRTCLLKGCGRKFRPRHPLERYCSKHCRDQARKWRQWKARHEYRQSPHGKQVRRAQSRRYRQRRKNKGVKKRRSKVREGHHKKSFFHAAATAPGATKCSTASAARPCNGSAAGNAGGLSSVFWSGSAAGWSVEQSVGLSSSAVACLNGVHEVPGPARSHEIVPTYRRAWPSRRKLPLIEAATAQVV
jgi:hypothetical protein